MDQVDNTKALQTISTHLEAEKEKFFRYLKDLWLKIGYNEEDLMFRAQQIVVEIASYYVEMSEAEAEVFDNIKNGIAELVEEYFKLKTELCMEKNSDEDKELMRKIDLSDNNNNKGEVSTLGAIQKYKIIKDRVVELRDKLKNRKLRYEKLMKKKEDMTKILFDNESAVDSNDLNYERDNLSSQDLMEVQKEVEFERANSVASRQDQRVRQRVGKNSHQIQSWS